MYLKGQGFAITYGASEYFRVFLLHVGMDETREILPPPTFGENRLQHMDFNIYRRSSQDIPAMRKEGHVSVPAQCRLSGFLNISDKHRVDFVVARRYRFKRSGFKRKNPYTIGTCPLRIYNQINPMLKGFTVFGKGLM